LKPGNDEQNINKRILRLSRFISLRKDFRLSARCLIWIKIRTPWDYLTMANEMRSVLLNYSADSRPNGIWFQQVLLWAWG